MLQVQDTPWLEADAVGEVRIRCTPVEGCCMHEAHTHRNLIMRLLSCAHTTGAGHPRLEADALGDTYCRCIAIEVHWMRENTPTLLMRLLCYVHAPGAGHPWLEADAVAEAQMDAATLAERERRKKARAEARVGPSAITIVVSCSKQTRAPQCFPVFLNYPGTEPFKAREGATQESSCRSTGKGHGYCISLRMVLQRTHSDNRCCCVAQ